MSIDISIQLNDYHNSKFQYHRLVKGIRHGLVVLTMGGTLAGTVHAQGSRLDGVIELSALNGLASEESIA